MKIRAWIFISFWAVFSFACMHLGFRALEKTKLSSSVSPLIMFMFNHFVPLSSCFASSYALKLRAQSTHRARETHALLLLYGLVPLSLRSHLIDGETIWFAFKAAYAWTAFLDSESMSDSYKLVVAVAVVVSVVLLLYGGPRIAAVAAFLSILVYLYQIIWANTFANFFVVGEFHLLEKVISFIIKCYVLTTTYFGYAFMFIVLARGSKEIFKNLTTRSIDELKTRYIILLILEVSIFKLRGDGIFLPFPVLLISQWISVLISDTDTTVVVAKLKEIVEKMNSVLPMKFIEYGIGMICTICFQSFFRITSFNEVEAFVYFAAMWLANMALLGSYSDFGVFSFLLANVVVGCTLGEFGLRGTTWLAFGVSLILYFLRLKLESLDMAYGKGERIELSRGGFTTGSGGSIELMLESA